MHTVAFIKHPPLHEPTTAQKHAGNYAKRKLAWQGMEIAIENEAGSHRRGKNRDGQEWEQRISHPYGYLRGTEGVDGDHVDCFVGPNMDADMVYVVHAAKINRWDEYDEDKCMLGFNSAEEAKAAFLANYTDPRFFGDMVAMPVAEFVAKAKATKTDPAMIKAQQLSLFDEVVQVPGSVKQDGTVIAPYTRVQKKARKPLPAPERPPANNDMVGEAHPGLRDKVMGKLFRFASGMSRIGDLKAGTYAVSGSKKLGIGVDVGELSANGVEEIARAVVDWHSRVFVDSGAFSLFRRGLKTENGVQPLDFDAILEKYMKISDAVGERDEAEGREGQVYFVMPDIVGDQGASLDLVAKYKTFISTTAAAHSERPIVPIQKGALSLADAYRHIVKTLGTDNFVVGIPSNEKAVTDDDLRQFMADAKPKQIHFLGSIGDKVLSRKAHIVADAGVDPDHISADANLLRSALYGRNQQAGESRKDAVARTLTEREAKIEPTPAPKIHKHRDYVIHESNVDGGTWIEKDGLYIGEASSPADAVDQIDALANAARRQAAAGKLAQFGAAGESKAERRRINADVVRLIKDGPAEYSAADKALMARYSGNGGCGDSLNEFYTDPAVADAMWTAVANLGVTGGTALEPSCGAGVFLHTAPENMRVTGVDIDPISAKVATVLHGDRHEIRTASLERFATSDERQFDAVVGNAPFGIRGGSIKDDKPDVSRADTYFIDTALDKTRPGGIVSMIVHHGVLDSARDRTMRQQLLTKGEFLGAIRMPNTAFEHSHTDVTSDIVFFKKRPQDVANALGTLAPSQLKALNVWDEDYLSGAYFDGRGKANIMGSVEPGWRAKAGMGNDITVSGSMQGVPAHIAAWQPDAIERGRPEMAAILAELHDDPRATARALGAAVRRPYELTKPGSMKTVDGVQYVLEGHPLRWHRVDEVMDRPAVTEAEDIARDIDRLVTGSEPADREAVAAKVKEYIATHGVPGKNHDLVTAAHQDRMFYRLIGAVNNDGSLSELLTQDANAGPASSFETAAQTLAVEHDNGQFSPSDIAARTGQSLEDVEDLLHASSAYAYAGAGEWTTMDHYLTGELWPKLDGLREALARDDIDAGIRQKYEVQAKKLDETIDPKSLEDVDLAVNHAFIPVDVVAAYFNDRKNESENDYIRKQDDMVIKYDEGVYTVTNGDYRQRDLLERYLNRSGVEKDEWDDIKKMNADFKVWLTASRFRDQIETLYNRKFRGFVPPMFSNAPIDIPGMNTEGLKQYQYGGTRWALAHGKGIIAADVGLGKTVRALMIARLMKLEGKAKRNMIVVPKSVVANWAAEAEKWFPGTKVLTIGETVTGEKSRPDTADERNKKLHQYMQNDYDFVFISQPAFNDLDIDPIKKEEYISGDFWVQRGDKMGNAGDKKRKAIRENYEQAIAQRDFGKRTDALYFNDLGVDMLMADEAHAYKNLYAVRNRFGQSPKFLGGGGQSKRALDMTMKARSVRDANGGKGVFFMTATPTKNSPLEIYSMLAHIAPEEFEKLGIRNSEEFLDRFCEFATGPCLQTDGSIEDALYVSGFKNMDELRTTMKRYIDRTTADEVGLVLPKRDDRMHLVDMSAEQSRVYEALREEAHKSGEKKDDGDSHIFSIMDKMGKAALDLELLGPAYQGAVSPKYVAVAKEAADSVKDGGQIVFCEAVQSHDKIKAALVANGIPEKEIAIFNAQTAKTGDARQKIADNFNAGKYKVVIGNKTMEEGVNLQKGTADIHHMDIAWEPATMQQRNGRGLRQGNKNQAVRIHSYLSKGSFDGYRYQAMTAKKSWQDLLWRGGDRVENLERPTMTRDEMLVMMSADPEAAQKQMTENRALAEAKYLAAKTSAASEDFMRFQSLKMNHAKLKNKDSDAAQRLRIRVAAAKQKLESNKYFKAKDALDSSSMVLLHPDTGTALQHGSGLEVDGKKWVVTSVNPIEQSVSLRSFGSVGKGLEISLPVDKMGDNVKPFDYREADETAEVSKHFATVAADPDSPLDMAALRAMPAAVITENHAGIQSRMKQALSEYKLHVGHGERLPYFENGAAKTAETYEASNVAGREGTTLMLPTEEHRQRAIQEYIAAEQGKQIRSETPSYSGRSRHLRNAPARLVSKYTTGNLSTETNPWESAGRFVFGEEFKRQARGAFAKHQIAHVRHAPTFAEALRRAAPTLEIDYSSHKWPQSVLAVLFARAKRDGILDQPLKDVVPKKDQYGYMADEITRQVWQSKHRHRQNVTDVSGRPVLHALTQIATDHGYNGLAAAMMVSAQPPEDALQGIMNLPLTDESVIASIAHLAARHPEIAAKPVSDYLGEHMLRTSVGHGQEGLTVGGLADLLRLRAGAQPETEAA